MRLVMIACCMYFDYRSCCFDMSRTLEKISGVVTGSDTRPDRTLSKALSHQHDLVGEGVVNGEVVDLVKTHWPERRGFCSFEASKIILLVRNPWDAMDSYFNMMLTNTHTKTLSDAVYEKFSEFYSELVTAEIETWTNFYRGYLNMAKKMKISCLLIRYEDLLVDAAPEMVKIMNFIYPDIDYSEQIDAVLKENKLAKNGSYRPRGSTKIGKSIPRYSPSLVKEITEKSNPLLTRLGYNHDSISNLGDWDKELGCKYSQQGHSNTFRANVGNEIRKDHKFGRYLTNWRKQHTDDDKSPLETKS